MPKQSTPRNNPSGGEKAILEAAENLFAEKGFDAVSMSAIARLAQTSKPNIYHHFKCKNDLYLAVLHGAAERSSSLLDALADSPGSFKQRLNEYTAAQLENILTHKRSTQLILREAMSGGTERGLEIAEHFVGKNFARLVAIVRRGQEEKEFRRDIDPALAAFMIIAANLFYFQASPVMQHIPEFSFTDDAGSYNRGVMDILLNGVLRQRDDKP